MKKFLGTMALMMLGLSLTTSCGSDDDNDGNYNKVAENYINVTNATYSDGTMPAATSTATLQASVTSSTAQRGAANVIRVAKDRHYQRFFIGVKGVPGYWTYTPVSTRATSDDEDWDDYYEIPLTNGTSGEDYILQVSGEDEEGNVTKPYETQISYEDNAAGTKVKAITYQGQAIVTMEHDNQGRLTHFYSADNYEDWTFSYGSSVTIKVNDEGDIITYSANTNSNGYITSMRGTASGGYSDNITFSYNSKGQLTQLQIKGNDDGDLFTNTITQTWKDDNIVSVTSVYSDEDEKEEQTITYSYGSDVNALQQFSYSQYAFRGFPFCATTLFGVNSSKLPTSVRYEGEGYTFAYAFNNNGSIKTESISRNGQTLELTYAYDDSNHAPAARSKAQTPMTGNVFRLFKNHRNER